MNNIILPIYIYNKNKYLIMFNINVGIVFNLQ